MLAKYDAQNPIALNRILEQGIQMRPFAQDIMSKAFEVAQQLLSDNAQKDPEYAKICDRGKIRGNKCFNGLMGRISIAICFSQKL